ncbi:MAG: 4-hydroxy-3-methylbut-2-enyl diphosphate reductase [uncultured Acidimicrobiales bacterium]|uniref:4-hydroxy-3-methylbut-2-enyl diphosphate reductase n=1 Tax=uncultured Acidimicrobiales bacterium TaxID=310071 RepID=A0A6J4HY56_9ACTN|nr:MAG: 4-hydroxy-3-methylbut-2-enyl diphosphate reductase [uncultured Acidimicrobiales bacterium]
MNAARSARIPAHASPAGTVLVVVDPTVVDVDVLLVVGAVVVDVDVLLVVGAVVVDVDVLLVVGAVVVDVDVLLVVGAVVVEVDVLLVEVLVVGATVDEVVEDELSVRMSTHQLPICWPGSGGPGSSSTT